MGQQQPSRLTCLCQFGDHGLPYCVCDGLNSQSDYEKLVLVYRENPPIHASVTDFQPEELVTRMDYVVSGVSFTPGC